jgi:hypothetical protein
MIKIMNIMKKTIAIILSGVVIFGSSCQKYLDVNNNPNQGTSATPNLILPQAQAYTANMLNLFNSYGAQVGGYSANAGGYGGFGTSITYNFSSSDYSYLFTSSYDNLEDYQSIINQTQGVAINSYYNAVARIMRTLYFQLLVDTYNDVPYTDALQGSAKLTPAYTDAKVIYKDLADQIDTALATIARGAITPSVTPLSTSDIMFAGDMTKWKQFANTLKLRILLRGNGKVTFSNATFDAAGFLTTDATINPGYTRDNGKQNPKWTNWAWDAVTGAAGNKAWMPTTFIRAFYDGLKITDNGRGTAVFYQFPITPTNQLGNEIGGVVSSPEGSFWYPSTSRTGKTAGNATGVLKGPDASFPVITAAESYFMQAEGVLKGINSGTASTLFNNGISASFKYLYTLPSGAVSGNPTADVATYLTDNPTSYLVNFSLATTPAQQLEAIITQKYIALNFVNSDQSWNDYRRTLYPKLVSGPGATAIQTFASKVSESTRPDKLPTRILYPPTEGSYNSANVPKDIKPFGSLIFWAQ